MSVLYIANTSKQHHQFMYRLSAQQFPRPVDIRIGQQVRLELSREDIDKILHQHRRYGLRSVKELALNRDYVGLCYNIDAPVPLDNERLIFETFDHNDTVLNARADDRREEAAVAIASDITNVMQAHGVTVPRAEVEMIEETRGRPSVATGYEVTAEGVPSRHKGQVSSRANKKNK